jgi:hypothetical protein
LQPVEKAQAHELCVPQGGDDFRRRAIDDAAVAVIVSRPVEHRDIVTSKQAAIEQPPIGPQPALRARHRVEEIVLEPPAFLAVDLAAMHLDLQAVGL